MRYSLALVLAVLLVAALMPSQVSAHNVGVDCRVRGDKVEVEGFYDDDTAAVKAKVQVLNSKKEIIASGVTDERGQWSFARPTPGKYEIHLDAGVGHRAKKELVVPASNQEAAPASISDGPTREEFTRTPWLKIAIGLVIIGGLSGAFVLATKVRKNASII